MGQAGRADKDSVYAAVRSWIVRGQLPPGAPISERELAQHFGRSRTPIREVLHRLQLNGLVEIYPQRGAFVRRLDPRLIADIFEARVAIEPAAAALAATRHDAAELVEMAERFRRLQITDDPESLEAAVGAGSALHDAIFRWAGNSLLTEFHDRLKDHSSLIRLLTQRSREIEEVSRQAHLSICEALAAQDPDRAEGAMRAHLLETRTRLLSQFQ